MFAHSYTLPVACFSAAARLQEGSEFTAAASPKTPVDAGAQRLASSKNNRPAATRGVFLCILVSHQPSACAAALSSSEFIVIPLARLLNTPVDGVGQTRRLSVLIGTLGWSVILNVECVCVLPRELIVASSTHINNGRIARLSTTVRATAS